MSYGKGLLTLVYKSLEYRRVNDLVLYYKIKNGLLDTDVRSNFIVVDILNIRGHSCKLIKQHCTIDATKFYFCNRIVSIWNSLSEDVVSAPSVTAFKKKIVAVHSNIVIWFVFMFLCVYL